MAREKKPKMIRDKLKDNIQKNKKKTEKKKHNERILKHRIIRDIRILYELEEEYYFMSKTVSKFWIITTLNMRVMVIKIGTYHQMNILTKLKLT